MTPGHVTRTPVEAPCREDAGKWPGTRKSATGEQGFPGGAVVDQDRA